VKILFHKFLNIKKKKKRNMKEEMNMKEEKPKKKKPKKKHSLGIVIPPKRVEITVVGQGGYYPSEIVDTLGEISCESSFNGSIGDIRYGSVVGNDDSEDVCDGVGEKGSKGGNEENSSKK
jgi:hypothetical protein